MSVSPPPLPACDTQHPLRIGRCQPSKEEVPFCRLNDGVTKVTDAQKKARYRESSPTFTFSSLALNPGPAVPWQVT